jgi:2-isopropylmalate synthase
VNKVLLLDSTLRDGAQSVGISFSVQDKLKIARLLDNLRVDYIEAGNPGSNPKDMEFFELLRSHPLRHAKLTAFGSTRRKHIAVEDDANIRSLLAAGTECVTIFGKSWDIHVTEILRAELEENLRMIAETVAYLKASGKEVVYDAEHFFDGYKANPDYALQTLEAAVQGGADCLCLCDTNGGTFPDDVYEATRLVAARFPVAVGIHAHDDSGMAVANSIMALKAGAVHVQGTLAGFGERCGNANLATILANVQLKLGVACVPPDCLERLTHTVHEVAEISNISVHKNTPYVGGNAFSHKGGMHVDGVMKNTLTFEHVPLPLLETRGGCCFRKWPAAARYSRKYARSARRFKRIRRKPRISSIWSSRWNIRGISSKARNPPLSWKYAGCWASAPSSLNC